MCGIAGIFSLGAQAAIDPAALRRMGDSLIHRGPDGQGYYLKGRIGLAHRRLSIIDIAGGDQPMSSSAGHLQLVFNGEIYNYLELRQELRQMGYQFETESDTEVILKAYEAWGVSCQEHFNGMWAFALWDERKQQLFVSRDRLGEKPLYFVEQGDTFLFASESKAFQAYGLTPQPKLEMLELYLFLGYLPAPYTFYRGVEKLRAGHYLLISKAGVFQQAYWQLPEIEERRTDEANILAEFDELFQDAVRLRMRSDAPYGAFLSGGLDSASIVANMARGNPFPINTFTIGFEEKSYDEREMAQETANFLGTQHSELLLTPHSLEESLRWVLHHFDEPFSDPAAIPTYWVSQLAQQKVKMVLTGDGGDELLAGYSHYLSEKYAANYHQLPLFFRLLLPRMVHRTAGWFHGRTRFQLNRAERVLRAYNRPFPARLISKFVKLSASLIKELSISPAYPIEAFMDQALAGHHQEDPFYQMAYFDLTVALPDQMLQKLDKMTMANSLEARAPFLDHRLIELMYQVDKKVKLPSSRLNKHLLKKNMQGFLPDQVIHQTKKGFNVPLQAWFNEPVLDQQIQLTAALDHLNADRVQQILQENKEGTYDHGTLIWRLILLDRWLAKH